MKSAGTSHGQKLAKVSSRKKEKKKSPRADQISKRQNSRTSLGCEITAVDDVATCWINSVPLILYVVWRQDCLRACVPTHTYVHTTHPSVLVCSYEFACSHKITCTSNMVKMTVFCAVAHAHIIL